ncbi:MAG: hypothetical protein JRI94_00385 [Deltaproteobacteria bacterium]|nr:hypothetical protein [Deltaproteobacteria bacterium]
MAIADDFTVAVNGDIRHSANANHYTVLELHRFLQDLADDENPATADDYVDITSDTPSEKSFDTIIELINNYNIDDDAAEYFYGGSVKQDGGDTLYSGLIIWGAVNNSTTQIQVIQDGILYDGSSPFWGDQSGGGYNGSAVDGILMRILVKSRVAGADINQKKCVVQARSWGDSYDFFNVTLSQGEATGALGTTPDAQNNIAIGTVQAWAGGDIPTNAEGWQTIDINNGDGAQPYYSKWTYNTNTLGMKALWNWIKEICGNDSPAASVHGIDGELFLGITHSYGYDAGSGAFTEDEILVWGTDITYDGLNGAFAADDYVVFRRAGVIINGGKIGYDNGSTQMKVALEDITTALADDDVIQKASDPSGVYADIATTIVKDDIGGGQGILLGEDAASDNQYIQVIQGVAPVDNLELRGRTSGQTCDVAGSVTARTVPKTFLGSYTGSLIGAYGIGIDADDLASTDRVFDLTNTERTPPNNVTFTLSGLVSGEDRILICKKDTGDAFDWDEMTLAVALTTASETTVDVGAGNIPADAPATGTLRITLDNGVIKYVPYTSHDSDDEFTIGSTSFLSPADASIANGVVLAFIDKVAGSDTEDFTLQFDAIRSLRIRVRDGGATPIKTYESNGTLNTTGGSAVASRISDA